jgi:hypothetical protein
MVFHPVDDGVGVADRDGTIRLSVAAATIATRMSVWLIDGDRYVRLPRAEAPRPSPHAIDSALDDGQPVEFTEAFFEQRGTEAWTLRLVPAHRGPRAGGIQTGPIVAATIRLP